MLGSGSDHLTVESTHLGTTTITGGAGDDVIDVRTIAGHTLIDAGAGEDTINVSSAQQRVDQIMALLTVDGGAGADQLNTDDTGDWKDNSAILTGSSLTGLDMPLVPEVLELNVRALSAPIGERRGPGRSAGRIDLRPARYILYQAPLRPGVLTLASACPRTTCARAWRSCTGWRLRPATPEEQRIGWSRGGVSTPSRYPARRRASISRRSSGTASRPAWSRSGYPIDIGVRMIRDAAGRPTRHRADPDRRCVRGTSGSRSWGCGLADRLRCERRRRARRAAAHRRPNNSDGSKSHTRNVSVAQLDNRYYHLPGRARRGRIGSSTPRPHRRERRRGHARRGCSALTVASASGHLPAQGRAEQAAAHDLVVITAPIASSTARTKC